MTGADIVDSIKAAGIRPYPSDRAPVKRKHPCVVCHAPASAVRAGTRCTSCSIADQRARYRVSGRSRPKPTATRKRPNEHDTDIARYRAEKDARREYGPATRDAQICFEVAAQLKAEKPKAGRPRKQRGFMPQTFGKYAA